MEIVDNGVGMNLQRSGTASLGMQLIKGLSKELKGTLTLKSDGGLKITVAFNPSILNYTQVSDLLLTHT